MSLTSMSRRTWMLGSVTGAAGAALLAGLPGRVLAQDASPVASPETVAADTFPVTIPHVYGDTVIEAAPNRIVTLGWSTQDAVIALGVDPIGIPLQTWGGDAEGFLPWTRAAFDDRELPTLLDTAELPYEDIVGLAPDVILAIFSGFTEEEYARLNAIAPTVVYPEVAWGTPWQDVQRIAGKALGRSAAASQLVADTEALVGSQVNQYPDLIGKTFIYGNMGDGSTSFNIYTSTDARSLFLSGIGLAPSPFVLELDARADPASPYVVSVSYEEAATLEADIVVFWFGTQEEHDAGLEMPTFESIPAVARGSFAPIIGQSLVMASSAFSVLSIPFMLDAVMPILGEAAANAG